MKNLEILIAKIENPSTPKTEIDQLLTTLNLGGFSTNEINEFACEFWAQYFEDNLAEILENQKEIESKLLSDTELKSIFEHALVSFKNRKQDMAIDIHKFIGTLPR